MMPKIDISCIDFDVCLDLQQNVFEDIMKAILQRHLTMEVKQKDNNTVEENDDGDGDGDGAALQRKPWLATAATAVLS